MESKEIFEQQTIFEWLREIPQHILMPLVVVGTLIGMMIVVISDNPLVGVAISIIVGTYGIATMIDKSYINHNRKTTVNIFMGDDHEYNKFVELSLKYLGYETKILDENDRQKRDFIILNDKHLVYVSKYVLSLWEIDEACKIAKEMNKSLTIIMDDWHTTHETYSAAYSVVNQGGIVVHDRNEIYNALYKTIKTKGGEPIRECLCT